MRAIDDFVSERFDISITQMMENAGRSLAELAIDWYRPESVAVLVGPGHNGGGGLVAARHLANRGVRVVVVPAVADDSMKPTTQCQMRVARAMGIEVVAEPGPASLVIDALIGYALVGDPQGRLASLIDWANDQPSTLVALDVPSGLDASTGRISAHCVLADVTMTLALPKTGLRLAEAVTGALVLADISIPRAVYASLGIEVPELFTASSIIRLA